MGGDRRGSWPGAHGGGVIPPLAGGVDAVQALVLALAMIGDLLATETVTLLGTEGSGFPATQHEEGTYVSTLRVPMDMSLLEGSA